MQKKIKKMNKTQTKGKLIKNIFSIIIIGISLYLIIFPFYKLSLGIESIEEITPLTIEIIFGFVLLVIGIFMFRIDKKPIKVKR